VRSNAITGSLGVGTFDGRALKIPVPIDEYSRKCLAICVARRIRGNDVVGVLAETTIEHGLPAYLCSGNGRRWWPRTCVDDWPLRGHKRSIIEPGNSWENGCCESFNGKFRDELLNGKIFYTLREDGTIIEQ